MLEAICQRYHCTPLEAAAQPVWVMRHIAILNEAGWGEREKQP